MSKKSKQFKEIPIDEKPLKQMFGDDPELFKEILNEFIAPTQVIINEIQAGCKQRIAEEVEMAAHKLKSSARSVGAFELGEICSVLEKAGSNKDWETIDQLVPGLERVMNEIEIFIKAL